MRTIPLFLALASPTIAATVNTGSLVTTFIGPPAATVNKSVTATVDLSNVSGLTPGNDIIITFTTADSLIWVGGFNADEADLTLNYQARFTLTVGTYTTQSTEAWSFGPLPWTGGSSPGYDILPAPPASFSLTVPWGTNLSSVALTLTDLSSVTGLNALLDSSSMNLDDATLATTSVPEPSAALLALFTTTSLLIRRRGGNGVLNSVWKKPDPAGSNSPEGFRSNQR